MLMLDRNVIPNCSLEMSSLHGDIHDEQEGGPAARLAEGRFGGAYHQRSGLPPYIEVARDEIVRVFRIKGKRHVAVAVCEGGVVLLRSLLR